jgi:hypothetical protein
VFGLAVCLISRSTEWHSSGSGWFRHAHPGLPIYLSWCQSWLSPAHPFFSGVKVTSGVLNYSLIYAESYLRRLRLHIHLLLDTVTFGVFADAWVTRIVIPEVLDHIFICFCELLLFEISGCAFVTPGSWILLESLYGYLFSCMWIVIPQVFGYLKVCLGEQLLLESFFISSFFLGLVMVALWIACLIRRILFTPGVSIDSFCYVDSYCWFTFIFLIIRVLLGSLDVHLLLWIVLGLDYSFALVHSYTHRDFEFNWFCE